VDSQVKERIVGAAVLVALGVWLIPWVLDGQDEPAAPADAAADAAALPAIEESAPIRTETVELTPDGLARSPIDAPQDSGIVVDAGAAGSEADAQVTAARLADAAEPDAHETDAPPAAVALRAPVAEPADEWVVQLGAFSDPANARQLASRVGTFGYEAGVSEFSAGGRTMHRVRIGGFGTRAEADSVRSSLSAHGFAADVVSPE